jgi:hypothetical protein
MTERAIKSNWKTLGAPDRREPLGYEYVFTDADADRLQLGLIPKEMEDKWFVYFEHGWLFLHRSWTGALIYWLRMDGCPAGIRVVESWVNRDSDQYRETDIAYDRLMLDFLLRRILLGHDIEFPERSTDNSNGLPGVYQHHVVGHAYPEKTIPDGESDDKSNCG